jgi:hypothetical protein
VRSFATFRISQYLDGLKRIGKGSNITTAEKPSHTTGQTVGDMEGAPIRENESQNA